AEREGGQDPIGSVIPAGSIEPAELEPKSQCNEWAEHETGNANPEGGGGHGGTIHEPPSAQGGDGSCGDADNDGDEKSCTADPKRDGQSLSDDFAHVPPFKPIRDRQIKSDETPEVATELD